MSRAILWCSKSKGILGQFEEMWRTVDMSLCRLQHCAQPQPLPCKSAITCIQFLASFWHLFTYQMLEMTIILVTRNITLHRQRKYLLLCIKNNVYIYNRRWFMTVCVCVLSYYLFKPVLPEGWWCSLIHCFNREVIRESKNGSEGWR